MDRRKLVGALALAGLAQSAAAQPAMPAKAPADSPRRIGELFAATLSAHAIEAFGSLFADDYRNHQASAAVPAANTRLSDKQGTIAFFQARLWGMPDLRCEIEAIVADDGMVAASYAYSGTHQGTLMGVAPTGRRLHFTSCDIFAVRGGLIAEHWGMGDIAGILAQLKR
jgi:predicted ester cyclase